MSHTVTLEPVDEVPSDCRVCHYDELAHDAKARVPDLADGAAGTDAPVDGAVADEFDDCDVVKYTEYYAVSAD